MAYFRKFFGHLKTIMIHKYWVFYYMLKMGYPIRGFFHDFSKLSPVEFFESVKYWNGKRSPILEAKEKQGLSYAWFHHRGRNKHHYEYWIDGLDGGGDPKVIPFKYVIEMVCDWLAAATTYNGVSPGKVFESEYEWWKRKSETAKIHPITKLMISMILWNFREYYIKYVKDCGMNEKCAEKKTLNTVRNFVQGWKSEYTNDLSELM